MKTLFAICVALLPVAGWAAEPVDYLRDVKPVFTQHCVKCHGTAKPKGGLRLDTAANALKGGDSGAVIAPGSGDQSRLVKAIRGGDGDVPTMPPDKNPRLSAAQISVISRWIDAGAKAPATEVAEGAKSKITHWAFQPVKRPTLSAVKNVAWVRNPIDYFILARLEKEGISPSPETDRATLARRLSLDLLGLPPSPEEIDAFVNDPRADAYERLVDRLLASPHYGERWGRLWLDEARYADSNGYSIDAARSMWPYRDWVIRALNADMPFDRFVIEQMAGDLLPNATPEQKIATGFHRNTPINEEGGIDREQFRVDSIYDRLNTTGTVVLGLTVGCAQCHDHKFDPLTQREYYQMFAFLNNDDEPVLELGAPEQVALKKKLAGQRKSLEAKFKPLDRATDANLEKWERGLTAEKRASLPPDIQFILNIAVNGRDEKQFETLRAAFRTADKARNIVGGLANPFAAAAQAHLLLTRNELERKLADIKKREPDVPTSLVLTQRATPRATHIHLGGDFLRKGVEVRADTPAWLPGANPPAMRTRLDLAKWLTDSSNPLTPRVAINRIWQGHFGLGIVETDNDFGTQGTPPSHPELLDWLASHFIQSKFSLKELHRTIVCSATYRQVSKSRPELATIDPRNKLLARMPRLRLEAELVRDAALTASGRLNRKIGGPSVFPPQPDGVFKFTQVPRIWKADAGPDRYRRGLYIHFWRSAPHPALMAFDAPDGVTACTRRNRSNTPLQALTLLNDEAFVELAHCLATRVLRENLRTDSDRLRRAFRLCLGRPPRAKEMDRLMKLLAEVRGDDVIATWTTVARVLLNLDEFITRE